MRTLIIATNLTLPGVEEQIKSGHYHRVDYLELGQMPEHDYLDYNTIPDNRAMRWIENLTRQDVTQARKAAEIVRDKGYEQVFSMSERVGIPLALMLPADVRHIIQFAHGLSQIKLALIRALNIQQRWSTIITPTNAEAARLRSAFGRYGKRVNMLYYPVDTSFYQPGPDPLPVRETDHFESLGLSYRDFPTLVRAMRSLPEIPCQIRIGSTWYDNRSILGSGPKPDNITFVPFVPPESLKECYLRSRFTVVPLVRTTQWSAGCTTVLQAQSMGRAVIATRNPGMEEYVQDGVTGMLVKQGSAQELADAIAYLWENPQVAEEMGRKAFLRVREIFSIDKWMDEIIPILCDND